MKRKWIPIIGLMALLLASCSSERETTVSPAVETMPAEINETELPADPRAVTQQFYGWYLDYIGTPAEGEIQNPLVDGAYLNSEYLSPAFIAGVEEILASFDEGGYDPVLLAQDVPVNIEVGDAQVEGDRAMVPIFRYWGGNPDPSPMTVKLVNSNGRWLIDEVVDEMSGGEPAPESAAPETPEEVVGAFYDWYLSYIGDPASDSFRNPLVDRAYHDSPLLTESLKNHIDELLNGDVAEYGGITGDPILCAQAIPEYAEPQIARVSSEGATVIVQTSFSSHLIGADLRMEDGAWRISNIVCPNSPSGAAEIFYDWYLAYIGDRSGDFRNPLVDRAYRDHPLLADDLEREVDALLDAPEGIAFDPFLLAQDIPPAFSVDPGVEPNTAVVHFQFGPDSVRHVLVEFEGGQIRAISEAMPIDDAEPGEDTTPPPTGIDRSEWLTNLDAGNEVSFQYPSEWVLEPMELGGPGMPEDWPVVSGWLLMPPDVAIAAAAQSGPPDPDAPHIVPPIQIEIISGGENQLRRAYPEIVGEPAMYGDNTATVVTMDPGYTHTIFAHPTRAELWLVVTDWVSGFPGREAEAEIAGPVVAGLLESITFTP